MGSKLFILKIEESCLFDLKKLSFEMLAMGSSGSMIYFISMGHAFMLIEEVFFENITRSDNKYSIFMDFHLKYV